MIVGDRISRIDAQINPNVGFSGFKIDIKMGDARREGKDRLLVDYIYTLDYEKMGKIVIAGTVIEADEKKIPQLEEAWKRDKKLPNDYMEELINIINFVGSAHGTIIARVLNVRPPIIPPKLTIGSGEEKKAPPKK
jgi:hypothetical protein